MLYSNFSKGFLLNNEKIYNKMISTKYGSDDEKE
jgi:hypothetical protein